MLERSMDHHHSLVLDDGAEIRWSLLGQNRASGTATTTPVVLIHGITETAEAWKPVADRLGSTRQVLTLDMRGHGQSSRVPPYDLGTMAADVINVITSAGIEPPHIVGHSLGGAVASVVGATGIGRSVVCVDQSLQLAMFSAMLNEVESALRDPASFGQVVAMLFDQLMGDRLPSKERARLAALREPDQDVVLGVWSVLFEASPEEITTAVDDSIAGYVSNPTPYLALFGAEPGGDYHPWLQHRIPSAQVEVWDGHDHYPHLLDPDRFVARLERFWETDS